MKYLLIILAIIGVATLATFIAIWPEQQEENGDTVVTINGRPLTRQDILDYKDKDMRHGQDEDVINEIITKKLLIEEAQRLNIDKEPDFRSSLKTFYEHSLIKILMERINQEISAEITEQEIDSFIHSFGKTFTFYTLKTSAEESPQTVKNQGRKYISSFDDLSGELQQILAVMQPGETATTFITGNEKMAIYLEEVKGDGKSSQNIDRTQIRQQLLQTKIENHLNTWIEDLRSEASITYHTTQE